jgi:hypothetical protein
LKITLSLSLFFIVFIGFQIFYKTPPNPYDKISSETIDKILANAEFIISNTYNLKTVGTGASMPGGNFRQISLSFYTKHLFNKEQITETAIRSADILLDQLNNNENVKKFLEGKEPFTIKNINITIFNIGKNRKHLMYPEISTVEIEDGILTFSSYDNEEKYKLINEFQEPYEEARKNFSPL